MNLARLWKKIVEEAIDRGAQAIHLEPEFIRFKNEHNFNDAFELSQGEYEKLLSWLELLGEKATINNVDLKIELHPQKAIIKIFKKSDRYLNNLRGLYFFDNKETLEEILDYLSKKDLDIISLEDQIELNSERGLTAGRAIDFLKSDVIVVPHLEEDILEAVVKKALTGKLVLVNKLIKNEEEGVKYLLQQGMAPHIVKSVWQGIIK